MEIANVAGASLIAQRLKTVAAELMRLADEVERTWTAEPPRPAWGDKALGASGRKYLTVGDAAQFMGLAKQTLNRWRVSGDGPEYHKLGRRVVYDAEELERWVQRRRLRHSSDEPSAPNRRSESSRRVQPLHAATNR